MSPSLVTFLFESANFLLLAAVLGWAFFRPVQRAVESRRAALDAEERRAAETLADAERRLAEVEEQRRAFSAAMEAQRVQLREQAEGAAAQIVEAARTAAAREHEHARTELAALRRTHSKLAACDAAAAARSVVVQLLARIGGPALESALVQAACAELRKLADRADRVPALVEVPAPISDQVRGLLAEALGCPPSTVRDRVVPDLIGGLRVITGAGLVDASVAGLAAYAERALLARIDAEAGRDA